MKRCAMPLRRSWSVTRVSRAQGFSHDAAANRLRFSYIAQHGWNRLIARITARIQEVRVMQFIRARQRLPDLRPQLRPAFIHPGSQILKMLFSEASMGAGSPYTGMLCFE